MSGRLSSAEVMNASNGLKLYKGLQPLRFRMDDAGRSRTSALTGTPSKSPLSSLCKRTGLSPTQAYIGKVEHQIKATPKLLPKVNAALR
jgi:hypothetical protein